MSCGIAEGGSSALLYTVCYQDRGVLERQGHEEGQRKSQGGRSELRWVGEKGDSLGEGWEPKCCRQKV